MEKQIKTCGRPTGRVKTAKIEVTIEPEIKDAFINYRDGGEIFITEPSIVEAE